MSKLMKKLYKKSRIIIALVLLATCLTVNGAAKDDSILTVSAPISALKSGDEFEISIVLDNNPGIVIFLIFLTYDNTRFDFVSATNGPVLDSQELEVSDGVFYGVPSVRVSNGFRTSAFTGNGVLYTVKFKVKGGAASGVAAFDLSYREGDIIGMPKQPGNQPNNFSPATVPGTVTVTGYSLTGSVRTYNPGNPTTIRLMLGETVVKEKVIEGIPGSGRIDQLFKFTGVTPGTYTLIIEKAAHTSFTVQELTVSDGDVDLRQDSRPEARLMTLPCGDINGDKMINDDDLTVLWMLSNYNRKTSVAANPLCDLNGDGMINDLDLTVLWMASNYNKENVIISP